MKKYDAEWVRDQARSKGAIWLDHHRCSLCRVMVGYVIHDDEVEFHSNCGCTDWTPRRPSSFQDIANWLAIQSSDEIRDRIMAGLKAQADFEAVKC